jgi:hypothetical protein
MFSALNMYFYEPTRYEAKRLHTAKIQLSTAQFHLDGESIVSDRVPIF